MTYSTYYASPEVMHKAMLGHIRAHEERAQRLSSVKALPAPKPGFAVLPACELKQALDKLVKVAAKKSTLPVLHNVLIVARQELLTLSATNLEVALTVKLACKGSPHFDITVNLPKLRDMLSDVSCSISLTIEGAVLVLRKQGAGVMRFKDTMPAGEYPTFPQPELHFFSIASDVLAREVDRMARCAASDEARPVFTGILFQIHKGQIMRLASADSYRLGYSEVQASHITTEGDVLIPASALKTLASMLPKQPITLQFLTTKNKSQLFVKWAGHTFATRLIEGAFPAYQRIMPDSAANHYIVTDARALQKLAEMVAKVTASESNNIVSLGWQSKEQRLVLSAASESVEQTEYLPAEIDRADATNTSFILFNARYLIDACKSFQGQIVIRLWDHATSNISGRPVKSPKPGTISALDRDNDTHQVVLMPMHTIR